MTALIQVDAEGYMNTDLNLECNKLIPDFILDKLKQELFEGNFVAYVIFCDISGFTALTEKLLNHGKHGSEILTQVLQASFEPMIEAIYTHRGFISSFGGDSCTAIFPVDDSRDSDLIKKHSVSSCREILNHFEQNGNMKTEFGELKLEVKIGVAFGEIEWGIVGNKENMGYYFRGSAIEKAAELEHVTSGGSFSLAEDIGITDIESIARTDFIIRGSSIDRRILRQFIPEELLNWSGGEFRQIATIFMPFKGHLSFENIDKLYKITSSVLTEYEGFLSRLDFGDKGAKFLIFFGFPKSHEDDLKRAFLFVNKFRNEIRKSDLNMFYTMGITYGLAYTGEAGGKKRKEYTSLGDLVNLAARLAFVGEINEIYCSKETAEKASSFARIPLSTMKLFKGKSLKLPVYRYIGMKQFVQKKFSSLPLIGRENEIKNLLDYLNETILSTGTGGVFYIHGNPGIGKSKLVYSLKEHLEENNIKHCWFQFVCDGVVSKSLDSIKNFLMHFFNQRENDNEGNKSRFIFKLNEIIENDSISRNIKDEILRTHSFVANELGITIEDSLFSKIDNIKLKKDILFTGLKELFKAQSQIKPLIMEIEDGQWLDSTSKEFIENLIEEIDGFPIMIIVTSRYRNDGSKVIFTKTGKCTVKEMELCELKSGLEEQFAYFILGNSNLSCHVKDFLSRKSSSNPFYIEQWLKHLKESNALRLVDDKWEFSKSVFDLPSSIDSLIIARIDSLGVQLKDMLQHASIIGQKFSIGLLSRMLLSDKDINYNLEVAEKAQMIIPEEIAINIEEVSYFFTHALIRDVAYEMQLSERRAALHLLVLNLIENLYKENMNEYLDELCIHSEKGRDLEKLKHYLRLGSEYDELRYRYREVIEKNKKLISLLCDTEEIDSIKLKQFQLHKELAEYNAAESIISELISSNEDSEDMSRKAVLYKNYGMLLKDLGQFDKCLDYFHKSLEIHENINTPDFNEIAEIYNSICFSYLRMNRKTEAAVYIKLLSEITDVHDINKDIRNNIFNTFAVFHKINDNIDDTIRYYEIILKDYKDDSLNPRYADFLHNLAIAYFRTGEYKETLKYIERSSNIYLQIFGASHPKTVMNTATLGTVFIKLKNYEEAEKKLKNAEYMCEKIFGHDHYFTLTNVCNMGLNYLEADKLELAKEYIDKFSERYSKLYGEDNSYMVSVYNAYAEIFRKQKKYKEAIEMINKSIEIARKIMTEDHSDISYPYECIGTIFKEMGQYDKAMEYLLKCNSIRTRNFVRYHPDLIYNIRNIIDLYELLSDHENAEKWKERIRKKTDE
ncbi:MAG: tetratricopeptide repeat protein [Candidatus Coatesbacteria bacterium]|nr:tetratricopeptide repeat protein [Candidatus Coatesbacteria bacterium]